MIRTGFTLDRLTIAVLAMTAALPFLALSPAEASPTQVDCRTEAQAIRSASAAADPKAAAKAMRAAKVGEKICTGGNRHEAERKFTLARQLLSDGAQLAEQR